jgi:hypothetical protein
MTPSAFVRAVEAELRARRVRFDLAKLLDFAASVWPRAVKQPEPVRWADEFLKSVRAAPGQK